MREEAIIAPEDKNKLIKVGKNRNHFFKIMDWNIVKCSHKYRQWNVTLQRIEYGIETVLSVKQNQQC